MTEEKNLLALVDLLHEEATLRMRRLQTYFTRDAKGLEYIRTEAKGARADWEQICQEVGDGKPHSVRYLGDVAWIRTVMETADAAVEDRLLENDK